MRVARILLSSLVGAVAIAALTALPALAGTLPNHNETVVRI